MKNIPDRELYDRFVATQGKLAHLATTGSRRRHTWEIDFHSIGDPFMRDFSVIQSSKAARRLHGKNQVASSVLMPHVRNRGTHVGEVMAHSGRLASHLGLNTNLALAIAAGHDIGHVPFGHQGEHYLQMRMGKPFTHELMGVCIAQHVERAGAGLNLTHATLDGMYRHSGKNASESMTAEAWIVRYMDKVAYLFSDYNDFKRLGWEGSKELDVVMEWFGVKQRHRTFKVMMALCEESVEAGKVVFENSDPAKMFNHLRSLMYAEYGKVAEQNVGRFLEPLYDFIERSEVIPPWLGIALLTDEEVSRLASDQRLLSVRKVFDTGLGEIMRSTSRDYLFAIDPLNLDLDW